MDLESFKIFLCTWVVPAIDLLSCCLAALMEVRRDSTSKLCVVAVGVLAVLGL